MAIKVEMEVYPGEWVEVDPHDLYDARMVSLATRMEEGPIEPSELNDTNWWVWDFTVPSRPIRIVESD